MKVLLASLCSMLAVSAAGATSVTIPDSSTSLPGVAAATTVLLLDAGLKPRNAGGGVFVLDAKNFHCDQLLNGALDASSVRAGLPALKCRINSQNKRGATAGQPFGEGPPGAVVAGAVGDAVGDGEDLGRERHAAVGHAASRNARAAASGSGAPKMALPD